MSVFRDRVWEEYTVDQPTSDPIFTGSRLQQLDFIASQYQVSAYALRKIYAYLEGATICDVRLLAFFNAYDTEMCEERSSEKRALRICQMLKRSLRDPTHSMFREVFEIALSLDIVEPEDAGAASFHLALRIEYEINCSIAFFIVNLMILELYFQNSTTLYFLDCERSYVKGSIGASSEHGVITFHAVHKDQLLIFDCIMDLLHYIYNYFEKRFCDVAFRSNVQQFLTKDSLPLWNSFYEPDSVANLISLSQFMFHKDNTFFLRCVQMRHKFRAKNPEKSIWLHPYFFVIQHVDFSKNNRERMAEWFRRSTPSKRFSFDVNLNYIVEEDEK